MSLLGKILTVVIFVLALVWMAFSVSIYATHKNWQTEAKDRKTKLDAEQAKNKELEGQLDNLKKDRDAAIADQVQAAAKLRSELTVLQDERKGLDIRLASLEKEQREAVAAMNATQKAFSENRKELEQQRTDVVQAQKDRDSHFKEVVRLTDELHQAVNDKEQLRKRTEDLTKDLARARTALQRAGIDLNADVEKTPPQLDGLVTATPGNNLVEISLGSDAGLRAGHQLEVYRTNAGVSTYVGRIEVVKTAPDKSVCKVDPKFQNSEVRPGDRVATKIK